ncbi:hypothetical protein SAMN05216279_1077 [Pseudomonas oryzihabitans]|uniref:Tetratricopeptide repeat-containing protein n=2 Tax=Pseudomonas oryzihabitans TaxID=47885 RepID=A0A1G5NP19_9PSED|nr:hypothetical protein SAMN05216279_1077 [Pseudomonas psychrotolerans]
MTKAVWPVMIAGVLLAGCAAPQRGAIPVVDSGGPVSNGELYRQGNNRPLPAQRQAPVAAAPSAPADSGVTVMVPGGSSAPLETYAAPAASAPLITSSSPSAPPAQAPVQPSYSQPVYPPATPSGSVAASTAPTGIPSTSNSSSGGLAADEQLDGPVLALLTTAQQQQSGGDLNGASSSLERAQRIAPREPQVLYRLAQVRLAQNDPAQGEQLARRALTYANGRPALQASLWQLIAQAREAQGDASGAALARQKAQVGT